ncbi:hypothetical protein ACFWPU_08880 [Streptomyces sp. NPDC058471]|uniref:hypothetical protein n=1 Tax=Streptomyces sp. NPDC058471 TaxID=3346516 RepID=UPI0036599C57
MLFGGHRHEAGLEFGGGEAGDQTAEALVAAVLLPTLAVAEVEVLDGDRLRAAVVGVVQQPTQRVPQLRVAVLCAAGQVVEETLRLADRVAMCIEAPGGEVVVVHVHPDHSVGQCRLKRQHLRGGALPGGGDIPAPAFRVVVDAVGHRPVGGDPVAPLLPAMPERHGPLQQIPAVRRVGQVGQRGRKSDRDAARVGDADGLVAEAFSGLSVGGQEHPTSLPALPPRLLAQPGRPQVVTGLGQALATAHHPHPARRPVRIHRRQPGLEGVQAAGLGMPLATRGIAAPQAFPLVGPGAQRPGQPRLDLPDLPVQPLPVCRLPAPGQCPLVVGRLGDTARPARRGPARQLPLTHRPPGRVMRRPLPGAFRQITGGERTEEHPDLGQHRRIRLRHPQSVPDGHPRRAGHHERHRQLP